jgi:hypothetical protein
MSKLPVRISGDGFAHKVEIDGHEVQGSVTRLALCIDAETRVPVLDLSLFVAAALDVETQALVKLDAETVEALMAMGWTPPEQVIA